MKHFLSAVFIAFASAFLLSNAVLAQGLPRTIPEAVGISTPRLERLDKVIQEHVDKEQIPGAVALIARHGKIAYVKAYGMKDMESKAPMTEDVIFRIASMTKPITTVAAMMLFEEGKFLLDDPVVKYIPAFETSKVLVVDETAKNGYRLEDARRAITVRHLLTQTSGIAYGFSGLPFLEKMYKDAGISDGLTNTDDNLAAWAQKLAGMPLANHPGEKFQYGLNTDLLGHLVEIWSGMPLDEFFRKRIFEPLQMNDTYFFLPEGKLDRFVSLYEPKPGGGLLKTPLAQQVKGAAVYSPTYHYQGPRTFFSGGAGLASTASDYLRFAQMLLNGGKLDGARLLSRKTVELMTSGQLGEVVYPWARGTSFGFGFFVEQGPQATGNLGSAGNFGWSGFFSTYFWVDPKEDMIGILMTQMQPNPTNIAAKFKVLVYQAIAE